MQICIGRGTPIQFSLFFCYILMYMELYRMRHSREHNKMSMTLREKDKHYLRGRRSGYSLMGVRTNNLGERIEEVVASRL
jgi:hypothetical protein